MFLMNCLKEHEERFVDDVDVDAVMVIALVILFVLEVVRMPGSCGVCGGLCL